METKHGMDQQHGLKQQCLTHGCEMKMETNRMLVILKNVDKMKYNSEKIMHLQLELCW